MNRVGIIILNWNGKEHLSRFLPSVLKYSGDYDVVVIDNNSSDDSVEFLTHEYPQIRVVHNPLNGGFAKGYNDGLKQIEGEYSYYILLNSDVEVSPNWIEPIISKMESEETLVACQPKVLSFQIKNKFEHAGAAGGYLDKNGYPFCRGRIFNEIEEDSGQYEEETEIFWATGACMFVQSKTFHTLGGFDETYFAHMEEIDLCWRMKLHGYTIKVIPSSVVYHLGGGTLNYMSPRKVYLNFRNSLFTLYKNYRGGFLLPKITWRFLLDYIAFVAFIANGEFRASVQVLKAQIHFLAKLGEMRKKRKSLKLATMKSAFNARGMYKKSIVFSNFIQRKKHFSDLESRNFY